MDFATLVRCVHNWRRRQDAGAHHVAIPGYPQAATKLLMQIQPQLARSEPHRLSVESWKSARSVPSKGRKMRGD
jgi:hypothetical protein